MASPNPPLVGLSAPAMGTTTAAEELIRVGCPAHNCGGRCLLVAHVSDGVITRLDADDRPDELASPQLRACARGRAYLRRQYHPDRLLHPLRRVGARGEGRFEQISWDEALDLVASEIERVRDTYGSGALFVPYGTGSYNQLNGSHLARRLLNLSGGCLGYYNDYSMAAIKAATPTVYGTNVTGNERQDWLNSRYILMWGWNPAEMRDETNSDYFVRLARDRGARVVCIDPRMSLSASLADEWVPIRPGTDAAMMSAMAYVMIDEGLYDADFVRSHCIGFDSHQMPPGFEGEESYSDYILGRRDGVAKTPDWAEAITGVPASTIARIGREYATTKPGILYQGYGMQRRAYGEQVVRAGCVLASITGNIGIPGGWASGTAKPAPRGGSKGTYFPRGENPIRATIPTYLWTEAILRGTKMGPDDGVRGAERLPSDIKLLYSVASNVMGGQHGNLNRTAEILRDGSLVEFIAVQDNFLTPTARFADVVLPACTQFETWGFEDGWKFMEDVILQPKLVEPAGESRSDYAICAGIAERLGIGDAYTEGRDEREWTEWLFDLVRETRFPDLPTFDEMLERNTGVWGRPIHDPAIAFTDFRADPEAYPLETPSGKIEIFSGGLHELGQPTEVPPIPKYIQEWESPLGPEAERFPLAVIGHHTLHRVHSTHDNNDWLEEAFPQRVFVNRVDAAARDIADGDLVRIWNDRGETTLPCRLTDRLMPGVIDVPQGAWWSPDREGVDRRGNVNVLTSERPTPLAFGNAQHTIMAQLTRADGPAQAAAGSARETASVRRTQAPAEPVAAEPLLFHFDASACTGCKACQVACKDRNGLPEGVMWRRVYEVSGGSWEQEGAAWNHDIGAYHLSLSCNHCERPVCAEVCPASAISRRPDGVVLIDPDRCTGCGYCAWACLYGAPQLDTVAGVMTKCDLCVEDIDEGRQPACVPGCPMRALDVGTREELTARHGDIEPEAAGMYPLPDPTLTEPGLLVTPHHDAARLVDGAVLANYEET
jgi:anaerobic dimethyl sulfoxide reductase subunit A